MARTVTPLSDPKCEAAKPHEKEYTLFDGQGLFLLVRPNGSKIWRFKFKRPDGRAGLATFGKYPALSLKAARERRAEALELLAQGIDPMEHAKRVNSHSVNTFSAVAHRWHSLCSQKWNPDHALKVWRRIEVYLLPTLGKRPIADLKARDLLAPLKLAEENGTLETASRLRQYMSGIMRLAVQNDFIDSNPAPDLNGAIGARKAKHRPALPFERLPELHDRLAAYTGRTLTRLMMELALHCFIRSSELRFARWTEIDFDRSLWTIPGQRQAIEGVKFSSRGAKMETPHLVPLSAQSIALLRQIQALTGRFELIFPSDHGHWKPVSENTTNAALRRMGYDTQKDICGHGFRAMACSALLESGLWRKDAIERQMSHAERNKVRAAYVHKAALLDERRLMCAWWSNYLDATKVEPVTPFEFAQRGNDSPNVLKMNFRA